MHHILSGIVLTLYGILALTSKELCITLAREDFWVEWLTFGAFIAASLAFAVKARSRKLYETWFIITLAIFCFVVAGEEISWGQRMMGFTPPKIFLQKNYQQEFELHNLIRSFLNSKWLVAMILAGWGIVLPISNLLSPIKKLYERLRIAVLPAPMSLWAFAGVILIIIYPVSLTGEYMELLTGCLFLTQATFLLPSTTQKKIFTLLPLILAAIGIFSVELHARIGLEDKIDCANTETRAMADAIYTNCATGRHTKFRSVEKRIYTAIQKGYLTGNISSALDNIQRQGFKDNRSRRQYFLDPWGESYWVRFEHNSETNQYTAAVYSFGPNRRRDSTEKRLGWNDDIVAFTPVLPTKEEEETEDDDGWIEFE